jgi:hypothetical protein
MFRRFAFAALTATLALAAPSSIVGAQKALVYCPVGIDAAGCDRVVAALQATFPDGVDRGYDGTGGTVDLRKADLHHYDVFIVPSLADAGSRRPYALLRAVAKQLRMSVTGRVAVYSGAPDQGNGNRPDKEVLIQNLARWAADGHTRKTGLVGLVALLDLSENVADRYSWVREIAAADVSADAEAEAHGAVSSVTEHGKRVMERGGKPLMFPNMASYGLHIGGRAAARTLVGAIAGNSAGSGPDRRSVLVQFTTAENPNESSSSLSSAPATSSSGSSQSLSPAGPSFSLASAASSPTLTTDKPDYMPGDTVTFSGIGWAPGDTIVITVHEDPTWSYPDRQFTAIANGSGSFTNRDMIVNTQDLGATFTATAVANPSGLVAQTTFTDGVQSATAASYFTTTNPTTCSNVALPPSSIPGVAAKSNLNVAVCAKSTVQTNNGNTSGNNLDIVWFSPTGTIRWTTPIPTLAANTTTTISDIQTPDVAGTWTIRVCTQGSACSGGGNQRSSSQLEVAGKQNQTITFGALATKTFGDADFTVGATATSGLTVTFAASGNCTVTGTTVHLTGAGSCTITASQAGDANFNAAPDVAQSFTIAKANQTIAFTSTAPAAAVYGGTYAVSATGGGSGNAVTFGTSTASVCTASGGTVSFVGVGTCTVTADQAGNSNYNAATQATQSFSVGKASQTITFNALVAKTYGDADFTVSATASSGLAVTFSATGNCSATGTSIHLTGAGSCTVKADQAGNDNYSAATQVSQSFNIAKASSTTTVTVSDAVFDGNAHGGTATVTGFGGLSQPVQVSYSGRNATSYGPSATAPTNAGDYTAAATFAGDADHDESNDSKPFSITKAPSTATADALTPTFDGQPHAGTGTCTNSAAGSAGSYVPGGVAPTNAGDYTFVWSCPGDANHNPSSANGTIKIGKAGSTTTVTVADATYDGNPHGGTAGVTGAGGLSQALAVSYAGRNATSYGPSATAPTNAGDYTASASYAGDANHDGSNNSANFSISKASSSTAITCPASVTYNGSAQTPCTVAVSGANLSLSPNADYTNNTNAGTASASYTYAGDANHTGSSDSKTFTIDPKPATVSIVGNPNKTYDGNTSIALTSANYTVGGLIGGQSVTVTKTSGSFNSANVATANSVTASLAPGDFTAGGGTLLTNYSFPNSATGPGHINAATLTYVADAKSRTFGASDPAFTGSVTGFVNSETVAGATTGTLAFATSATQTSNVGSYPITGGGLTANNGNYTFVQAAANATALTITQATATVTITWNNSVYTAAANAATAQVTGVLSGPDVLSPAATFAYYAGSTVSGSPLAGAPTDAGTYTVRASFAGNTNYAPKFADRTITIDRAPSTTTVSALTVTFDGVAHPTTAVVTGVGTGITQTVTWAYSGNCSAAPVFVSHTPCTAAATYAGDANHYGSSGSNTITITKATPAITWNTPADINWPTALGATQLNAVVYGAGATPSVLSGTSTYTPASGTVLTPGMQKPLVVSFVPTDNVNYTNAAKTVYINVIDATEPIVTNTTATPNPLAIGSASTTITATISDVTTGGSNISSACFRIDGGSCQPMTAASGSSFGQPTVNVTGAYTFPAQQPADVIELCVYGTDSWGNTSLKLDCSLIAVYDPKNGFVTGGGWIMSPEGAYPADSKLVGKATFGFVSKYQNGKTVPQGNTEFQFHVANFNFKSTVYEWLVVAGARAQYKGSGMINGSGDYGFLLTAIDGQINGGGGEDKFRIKIWNKATGAVIYDNNMGMDDTGNPTTLLGNGGQGGGSIVIQQK